MGLHAVQFGNENMRKIPRTGPRLGSILAVSGIFFNQMISKLDKHVVLLRVNYIVHTSTN